ncbi:MAG TPA: right-handed parallel beta-helix repeat-containing protein [Terriglobales bacterium]
MSCGYSRVRLILSLLVALVLCGFSALAQNTIHVPGDQSTIQAAINAASAGDTVLVAPGTYAENINFAGKAITVTSSGGASVTIIDGGNAAPVVTFASGEGSHSLLNGFTIQNGTSTFNTQYEGGGIYIRSASPTITNNVIQNNTACSDGGGIAVSFGSPTIQGNTIQNNTQSACSGGSGGGGIALGGAGTAQVIGNVIVNNTWPSGNGGGISMNAAGAPTIKNNIIAGNTASGVSPAAQGGGISMVNDSDPLLLQNLIYNNSSDQGGGVFISVPSGSRGPILLNNTIAGNLGGNQGSAVYAIGFDSQVQFFNNLMIGTSGSNAVFCDGTYSQQPPTFTNNDAFSSSGTGLDGTCAGQAGLNGNVSADPQFVNSGGADFHLQPASPAVDAGVNSAPSLPPNDFAGNVRVLDGNNDCVSTIDLGAYELVRSANVSFSSNALAFPSQPIGTSSSPQSVTLSNTGTGCFQFSSTAISGDFSQTNTCSSAGLPGGASCAYSVTFAPSAIGSRAGALAVGGSDGINTTNLDVALSGVGADFSVAVAPSSVTVKHGSAARLTVTLASLGGAFNSPVALSCSGLPSTAQCSFSPPNPIPGTGTTSALTLSTTGRTPRGNFNVLIVGTSGSDVHSATVLLTVK